MSDRSLRTSRVPAALGAAAFVAFAALAPTLGAFFLAGAAPLSGAPAPGEADSLKQIKSDVFDQKWDAVLSGCSQFIARFPRSADLPRAYYYRGQALEHSKGREEEAIAAYNDFLTRFPNETGALKEDALLSRMTMATSLYLNGNKKYIGVLTGGMDESGYPRMFAAIQASKIDHDGARSRALPILVACAGSEKDAELRNECLLGVLRIDPQKASEIKGPTPPRPPLPPTGPSAKRSSDGLTPPPPPPAAGSPRLIRVEVYDKVKKQVSVRVNMPLAFWELLFDSLGEELHNEIDGELKKKGVQLDRIWDSIKKSGKQTIVEIDNEEQHIKVWVE